MSQVQSKRTRQLAKNARNRRRWHRRYGLSDEVYQQMVKDQKGLCLICRHKRKLCIDHDHRTGVVRGLLCQKCNMGLGALGDDPKLLRRALHYLGKA